MHFRRSCFCWPFTNKNNKQTAISATTPNSALTSPFQHDDGIKKTSRAVSEACTREIAFHQRQMRTGNTDTFHQFIMLPFELRSEIWSYLCQNPRVISFLVHFYRVQLNSSGITPIFPRNIPPVLLVCAESRKIALERYYTCYIQRSRDGLRERGFYINLKFDILYLTSSSPQAISQTPTDIERTGSSFSVGNNITLAGLRGGYLFLLLDQIFGGKHLAQWELCEGRMSNPGLEAAQRELRHVALNFKIINSRDMLSKTIQSYRYEALEKVSLCVEKEGWEDLNLKREMQLYGIRDSDEVMEKLKDCVRSYETTIGRINYESKAYEGWKETLEYIERNPETLVRDDWGWATKETDDVSGWKRIPDVGFGVIGNTLG